MKRQDVLIFGLVMGLIEAGCGHVRESLAPQNVEQVEQSVDSKLLAQKVSDYVLSQGVLFAMGKDGEIRKVVINKIKKGQEFHAAIYRESFTREEPLLSVDLTIIREGENSGLTAAYFVDTGADGFADLAIYGRMVSRWGTISVQTVFDRRAGKGATPVGDIILIQMNYIETLSSILKLLGIN